ncbi:MAG: hypothetical protein MZU97_19495 [Bacillus subtilis]|nr:hypothetical protein [Bacillus subtilis]
MIEGKPADLTEAIIQAYDLKNRAGILRPHQRRATAVDRRHVLPHVSWTIPKPIKDI